MSERSLAIFLHGLLEGRIAPAGPVRDAAMLRRLTERPAPALQALLGAHLDALLAGWPGGPALRPAAIPAAALWAGAALNNLAWSAARADPRLLTATLRMVEALPAASSAEAALAYHSLLRHLVRIDAPQDWLPVARQLVARSPLTAAWLPRIGEQFDWALLLDLLSHPPIRAALRDRLLSLLPRPEALSQGRIDTDIAMANAETGRLLAGLLEHGGLSWRPFVLALYEADCALQRRGDDERPQWPLLDRLRAARASDDPLLRRNAQRLLARYGPLAGLLADERLVRPYLYLDAHFLEQIGALLPPPAARVKLRRVSG
jgi:hypothetical protein